MQSYRSWARLIAGSGLAAVTYTNHEPVADARAILEHLRDNGEALQIDRSRIGLWACSGNVPTALSLLMSDWPVVGAALLYGYMLDLDGSTEVADAARLWRFANPAAQSLLDDLPPDRPLLIVRAGRDTMAGVNDSIGRFTARALARNKPFTLVNVPEARHAFDTVDRTPASRHAIACVLAFLRQHMLDAS
jgi:acetyl esterase/lipase